MIDLGTITIRDQESVTEAREKVLGLVRALSGPDVLATRTATAVSEAARQSVTAGGGATIHLALDGQGRDARLILTISPRRAALNPRPLYLLFESVREFDGALRAELSLPALLLEPELIARERSRIANKSRAELMEELRAKNRELEEHNERLEAVVAERTVELRKANSRMQRDLDAGAAYVRALVPAPLDGPFSIGWRYIPSSNLGGDTIGYHWLDDQHLALYLIDVTGHGLDSALLAVTITNVIRSGSLRSVDMLKPEQVIAALNQAFQGEHHNLKYFTIWYGVYEPESRRLTWSGGGHHPAVLLHPRQAPPTLLPTSGPIMGAMPELEFPAESCTVPPASRLLLFSDGLFEILRNEKLIWSFQGLLEYLTLQSSTDAALVDALLAHVRSMRGVDTLDDDLSIIEAYFP